MATAPDGKIYGMPQWVDCYHCTYQDKLWMNSTWLKKLGLEQPKTTEDMRKVLQAFKTQDPNGNGKADEIPLSADVRDVLIPYFMNAFIYDPQGTSGNNNSTLVLNDGKVDLQANKDGWRAGPEVPELAVQGGPDRQGRLHPEPGRAAAAGRHAGSVILGSATVLHPGIFVTTGSPDGRDKQYDAVPPLTGPDGANFTGYNFPSAPGATFVLTNKATQEEQIQAIKLLDYIFTDEGQINGQFGTEGKTWTKPADRRRRAGQVPEADVQGRSRRRPGRSRRTPAGGALAQYNNTATFRNSEAISTDIYSPGRLRTPIVRGDQAVRGQGGQGARSTRTGRCGSTRRWPAKSRRCRPTSRTTCSRTHCSSSPARRTSTATGTPTSRASTASACKRYLEIQQTAYDKMPNK